MTKRMICGLWAMAAAVAMANASAQALTTYGTLSNFDAVNDTGQICNGFRIELDGISAANVNYTFGAPYNRYGTPMITSFAGGVYVEYDATFSGGAWSTYTPAATTAITTGGHQFWTGGDPNYPLKNGGVPGDHFGLGLTANPTNTVYQWLTGDALGALHAAGPSLKLPAPVITAAAGNGGVPAVQVVVAAPVPQASLFGTPEWVKVFIADTPDAAVPLDDLRVGNAVVSDQVEIEWLLLQKGYADHETLDSGLKDLNAGAGSFVQRYEFYKYAGTFDSDGQALTDTPSANLAEVGNFIGSQIVAINLAQLPVPEPASMAVLGFGAAGLLFRRRKS